MVEAFSVSNYIKILQLYINLNNLGISAQLYCKDQKKIQDFTLGMIEMKQQNTGSNLKQEVMNLLSLYNINILQIYSCTSDNGKNMIKLGKFQYFISFFKI